LSISKHTTYNVAGAVLPIGVTLITVPLYLEVVGVERYGILSICWVLLGYFGFLDLGLGPAVAQKIASARNEDGDAAEAVFWTAVWLSLAAGLASALLVYAGAAVYFAWGGLDSRFSEEIRKAVPLLGLMLPIGMLSGVAAGALQGRERFLALNLISTTSATLTMVLPLAAAYFWSPTLRALLAGALAARVVGLVLSYSNSFRAVPLTRPAGPQRALIPSLMKLGGWMTVSTALTPFLVTIDRLAIGALLGAAAVAAYAIPFSLIARMSILPWSLSSALFPRFAAGGEAERGQLMGLALAAMAVTMTPFCILVIAVAGPVFAIWIGPDLAAISTPVAYLMIAGAWANGMGLVPFTMLQGSGRADIVAKTHLLEILPYLLLLAGSLLLFGLPGAALAWAIRTWADFGLLFWRAGASTASLRILIAPVLLLLTATISALVLKGVTRDLILWLLVLVSGAWSFRTMPEALWTYLRTLAGNLGWKRRQV
jgi:O-antigen/teichoic acid export membrane protein